VEPLRFCQFPLNPLDVSDSACVITAKVVMYTNSSLESRIVAIMFGNINSTNLVYHDMHNHSTETLECDFMTIIIILLLKIDTVWKFHFPPKRNDVRALLRDRD
jgi:hypothetical protein